MKEYYENWKELKPLTAPVPVGTMCVVIGCDDLSGSIVTTLDQDRLTKCALERGPYKYFHFSYLALLPSESAEPAKVERKIVQIALTDSRTEALCDDGTVWRYYELSWKPLPPIPQDAV